MKIRYIIISFLAATLLTGCNPARNEAKLIINEVLMDNADSYLDSYGEREGWIEIFNKSYNDADLAGCHLMISSTPGDTLDYTIPKGDIRTNVSKRQQVLFFADGHQNKGTFHTNFVMDSASDTWIGLYDTNGEELYDEVYIPGGTLKADQSYARIDDASEQWEIKGAMPEKYVTPGANNMTKERNLKMEKFETQDENGTGMALTAMSVVFCALLTLFLSFKLIGAFHVRKREEESETEKAPTATPGAAPSSEDELAAIFMALHEHQGGMHDIESGVITIQHTETAWSNKADTLRIKPTVEHNH